MRRERRAGSVLHPAERDAVEKGFICYFGGANHQLAELVQRRGVEIRAERAKQRGVLGSPPTRKNPVFQAKSPEFDSVVGRVGRLAQDPDSLKLVSRLLDSLVRKEPPEEPKTEQKIKDRTSVNRQGSLEQTPVKTKAPPVLPAVVSPQKPQNPKKIVINSPPTKEKTWGQRVSVPFQESEDLPLEKKGLARILSAAKKGGLAPLPLK